MASLVGAAVDGLQLVLAWPNILYPVLGTLLSMVFAFLPGLGGVTLMALAIPFTFSWDRLSIVLLFGAFVGGATFMGSVTSILFNVPGTAPSAATMLDGYPMAVRGEAKTAIACAASASALGSTIGIFILIASLPVMQQLILAFGPPEFLLLAIWGLTAIAMVSRGSWIKGLAMAGAGLMLAFVGQDPRTAELRYTFGSDYLIDGLKVVPVLLGLFAVAEMIDLFASGRGSISGRRRAGELAGSMLEGCLAPLRHLGLLLRSSVIGTVIGIIPGIGGTVASFVAYGHAVQTSRRAPRFGDGDIRGVLAPEAAHDAKDGGSLVPVLAFGVPGSEGTILLLTVFTLHGIVPGRELLSAQLPLVFALIWSLFLSNWLTSLLGLAVSGPLARTTVIRSDFLVPFVLALIAIAAVIYRGQPEDLVVTAAFGLFGYYLKKYGWPRVPFVIALVLGPMFEINLHLTTQLERLGRIHLLGRPIAAALALLIVLTLLLPFVGRKKAEA
jgi:putative tricarboxylic transport membrane protein